MDELNTVPFHDFEFKTYEIPSCHVTKVAPFILLNGYFKLSATTFVMWLLFIGVLFQMLLRFHA
jgi:hypothetical protein